MKDEPLPVNPRDMRDPHLDVVALVGGHCCARGVARFALPAKSCIHLATEPTIVKHAQKGDLAI